MSTSDYGYRPRYQRADTSPDDRLLHGMERQQRDWEREFDRLKNDFFKTKFDDTFDGFPSTLGRQVFRTPSLTPSPNPSPPREVRLETPLRSGREVRLETPLRSGSAPPGQVSPGPGPVARPYRVVFDLEKYAPEDVKVTLDGDALSVEAVREVKQNGNTNVQQYSETVYLPKYVHPERLISKFSNGRLVIEHPLPPSYNEALVLLREMRGQSHS